MVTRVEVIDHRPDSPTRGRAFVARNCSTKLSYQDAGRTLKIFVTDFIIKPDPPVQPVYLVVWTTLEGLSTIKGVYRSYDAALEAAKRLMLPDPEVWEQGEVNRTWFYGCDSVSIEEYVLQGKP